MFLRKLIDPCAFKIGNPVPTYFFTYDSQNNFNFIREEKSLWLSFYDLVGNFKIDWKESERMLEGVDKISNRK